MTPSPSGTRSRPNHQPRPPAARRYRQTANSGSALKVTFCVRGVSSPLLANLFLHYAFDAWMSRNYPHIPFERYADDAICHCKSAEEARALWSALQDRFAACKLVLHPEKTKIVYCKDANRRGDFPNQSFDFLGFAFRARKALGRGRRPFACFLPAASPKALTSISRTVRRWALHHRSDKSLQDLAEMYNPCIRGWINYYSHFSKTQLRPTLKRIDLYVIRWARRKFKRLHRKTKGARDWFDRLRRANPTLLPTGGSAMETAEHREPYESRGSRTDLGAPGGESPPGDSTRAAVVARLMVRPVCPQRRKCRVRPGSYAWCQEPPFGSRPPNGSIGPTEVTHWR